MPRLGILIYKSIEELTELYELCCTDLAHSHEELSTALSELHKHYLEIYAGSNGKSVAEKNREADFQTRYEYADILQIRGRINKLVASQTMLSNLISWRFASTPTPIPDYILEYPPNKDERMVGNGK